MKEIVITLFLAIISLPAISQSFEVMPGHERLFMDAQYLKFFNEKKDWSLFSRARATSTYNDGVTDLFSAGYLNYTSKSAFGVSLTGRISSLNSGFDLGPHFNKKTKKWTFFLYPSINLSNKLLYSWFSIIKFTPSINDKLKLYTSLEVFSFFNKIGHISSGQRVRVGLNRKGFQFGIAFNLRESGTDFSTFDDNIGAFLRKEF